MPIDLSGMEKRLIYKGENNMKFELEIFNADTIHINRVTDSQRPQRGITYISRNEGEAIKEFAKRATDELKRQEEDTEELKRLLAS